MTAIEMLIFAIALLGVMLGILNLWYSQQSRHVQLRVIPKLAFDVDPGRYVSGEWNKYTQRLQEDGAARPGLPGVEAVEDCHEREVRDPDPSLPVR